MDNRNRNPALYLVGDDDNNYIMIDDIFCSNIISSVLSLLTFTSIAFLFKKYFKDIKLMLEGDFGHRRLDLA